MTRLAWGAVGERTFHAGVDRGVLYLEDGTGVVWNGLLGVAEAPSGNGSSAFYLDGQKFLTIPETKEFQGTLEAYTYPEEFADYDGWAVLEHGLMVDEQERKPFGLSYRTRVGNDVEGAEHAYKIHIIYDVIASPTESQFKTLGASTDPINFSWSITTTPRLVGEKLKAISHVVIDSRKTNPTQLQFLENYLYGTQQTIKRIDGYEYMISQIPTLPTLEQLFAWFENPLTTWKINQNAVSGISTLLQSQTLQGDVMGRLNDIYYHKAEGTRLAETNTSGIYTLGAP